MGDWKRDQRPARGLWAPGNHINKCRRCAAGFIGAKRASWCADCAYAEPDVATPPVPADGGEAVARAALALLEACDRADPEQAIFPQQMHELRMALLNQPRPTPAAADQKAEPGDGMVRVPAAALRWLFGEEGEFECPPDRYFRGKPPAFWWRSVFREMIAASPAAPAAGAERRGEDKLVQAPKIECRYCGDPADRLCADCMIDLGAPIHVCERPACRDAHEKKCPAELTRQIAALRASMAQCHVCCAAGAHRSKATRTPDATITKEQR